MAIILNIETSAKVCSVAVTREGAVEFQKIEYEGMNHARLLAPFVDECMAYLKRQELNLDAVAVSIGPGSYTGLRIGLSLAKGLCFGADISLIGVSTLEILAVKAMFSRFDFEGDELLVPMVDARRMEVFTATYDFALREVQPKRPLIVEPDSYDELLASHKLIFVGDGAGKVAELIQSPNAHFMPSVYPTAADMTALSEKAFRENRFIDLAYSTPEYLKEFQATTPRK